MALSHTSVVFKDVFSSRYIVSNKSPLAAQYSQQIKVELIWYEGVRALSLWVSPILSPPCSCGSHGSTVKARSPEEHNLRNTDRHSLLTLKCPVR